LASEKKIGMLEDQRMNIPTKLGFREEDWNVRGPTNEHSYQA
jgi:hypothetical protein